MNPNNIQHGMRPCWIHKGVRCWQWERDMAHHTITDITVVWHRQCQYYHFLYAHEKECAGCQEQDGVFA